MSALSGLVDGTVCFKDVVKSYDGVTVVKGLNLAISAGEFFSLLGPSGSGKTTVLMLLAGFAELDSGAIYMGQHDIGRLRPQARNLGMVFQNYALFPHMTVQENLLFPLKVRKLSAQTCTERVRWALDLVHLTDFAHRYPRQLSGGQQQRVALARAIVFHPKVVLMDEPLGALDKNLRYQMQSEIKALQRDLGMTVIFVTHDQEEAMNMSDRIGIMSAGVMQQVGTSRELYQTPVNKFTAGFLGGANFIEHSDVELHLMQQYQCQVGQCLFIRPECLLLGPATEPGLPACVQSVVFLGSTVRYQLVLLSSDKVLYADVPSQNAQVTYQPGQLVSVQWSTPEDVKVIQNG